MIKKRSQDLLCEALKLHPHKDVISIVGGGGKTSTLLRLAKELQLQNKKIILTTTTHIERLQFDMLRYSKNLNLKLIENIEARITQEPLLIVKRKVRGNKLKGIKPKKVDRLNRDVNFDYMLVEADGAKNRSLKAPHTHEPPVPHCTTFFIVVVGFDIIGKKLNKKNVHRPQNVARITEKSIGDTIKPEDIVALLNKPKGLLKNRPPATRTAVILNKVLPERQEEANKLADSILKYGKGINSVICGQLNQAQQLLLFT
ncbi:MAG: selenium cofactor biosynthesis protein YqeC [Elusimicrobiota bacterium]